MGQRVNGLNFSHKCQGSQHLGFLTSLPTLGAKERGEGQGLKAVSGQHEKWTQTISPMKIRQAWDSPPEGWREPACWASPLLSVTTGYSQE